MTHFGLMKLKSSNLLDITIFDGYIVLHIITNLQNMAYIVGCKIVIKSCRSKKILGFVSYIYLLQKVYIKFIGFLPPHCATGNFFEIWLAAGENS